MIAPPREIVIALADRYLDERHVPKRTCLGCGGTLPVNGSAMCSARGVEFRSWGNDRRTYRLTWRELEALATDARSGVEQVAFAL